MLPADPTAYFAVVNVKTGIMCIRAGLRIKTTLTNSSAIRKKADYEYRYYKANGNGTVQNGRRVLKEYMIKGFTMNDERLKQGKTAFGRR